MSTTIDPTSKSGRVFNVPILRSAQCPMKCKLFGSCCFVAASRLCFAALSSNVTSMRIKTKINRKQFEWRKLYWNFPSESIFFRLCFPLLTLLRLCDEEINADERKRWFNYKNSNEQSRQQRKRISQKLFTSQPVQVRPVQVDGDDWYTILLWKRKLKTNLNVGRTLWK